MTESESTEASSRKTSKKQLLSSDVTKVRILGARIVWGLALLFAAVLALAALLITLEANTENSLVEFIGDFANGIDLGIFALENPIKMFDGDNSDKKIALLNYGLGAVAYLVVGRLLERAIRP